jgi:hypothetical protein
MGGRTSAETPNASKSLDVSQEDPAARDKSAPDFILAVSQNIWLFEARGTRDGWKIGSGKGESNGREILRQYWGSGVPAGTGLAFIRALDLAMFLGTAGPSVLIRK